MHRRSKRAVLILSICLPALVGIALVVGWSFARYQQRQFEKLSVRASALRIGESTFDDLKVLQRQYRSQALVEEAPCTPTSCKLRITLANFLMNRFPSKPPDARWFNFGVVRRLGLRPAGAMLAVIVGDGKIQSVHFSVMYESPYGTWLWAQWHAVGKINRVTKCADEVLLQRHPSFLLRQGHTGSGAMSGTFVSTIFASQANPEELRRCRYINFSCVTSLADCARNSTSEARLLMPLIYQDMLDDDEILKTNPETSNEILRECVNSGRD